MDIEIVKKELINIFDIEEMGDKIVIHTQFYTSSDETSPVTLCVLNSAEGIVITDLCQTYENLKEIGITIDNEQNRQKLDRMLEYSLTEYDEETKEFFVIVDDIKDLSFGIARLLQTILVVGALDIYVK